jgi:nucleotide-binding universal stress UspA family protein
MISTREFELALAIAKHSGGELHMVSVRDIDHAFEFIEDVRQQQRRAARRLHTVLQRARAMAASKTQQLRCHLLVGNPVRAIASLASDLKVELLSIGARGHSALYERVVGGRANRIMRLAQCPVLVVKSDLTAGIVSCLSEPKLGRSRNSGAVIRFQRRLVDLRRNTLMLQNARSTSGQLERLARVGHVSADPATAFDAHLTIFAPEFT